ncbi:MAG: hypothetical protein CME59_07195 [Halioglobus sp.]|mgnify:CR=1 FL=1|nr:hypothetical protein [Halioglobus sp.]|tara:strand:+ start:1860 stop:2372 length:513 start_codon:yes stop_codon:yes gene_type:complete
MSRISSITVLLAMTIASVPAGARELSLEIEVPRLQVAEYHRPYLAIWVARTDNSVAQHLSVLYDLDMENQEGEKWLKDMRQWWRRGGRKLDMPVDGVSGATIGPGVHRLDFSTQVADLAPGEYRLMVEASREVGGREVLAIPFQWPPRKAAMPRAAGGAELGTLVLHLGP